MTDSNIEMMPEPNPDHYTYSSDNLMLTLEGVDLETVYICSALKSGLRVEDLTPEDKGHLLASLGPNWYSKYEKYYLNDS